MAKGKAAAADAEAAANGASKKKFGVTADALAEISEVREAPRCGA
jgi:hypothetical protein